VVQTTSVEKEEMLVLPAAAAAALLRAGKIARKSTSHRLPVRWLSLCLLVCWSVRKRGRLFACR
jgi:hypothetical protein